MKRPFYLVLAVLIAIPFMGSTQQIELPRLSPKASVGYTIGLTDVNIHYSSPAVKERIIWGNVVPYDKIWRGGANEATTIEFSTDVNVEGQMLKAGKYALFFIPGQSEWTVIFNKKTDQWGAYGYEESDDALRITVTPKMNEGMQERLTYSIHDMKMDMGYVKLAWEKLRLYIRFKTEMMSEALANITDALEKSPEDKKWIVYAEASDFLTNAEGDEDLALDFAKKSTERFNHSWNWYVRAKAEARKGDMISAVASGTKAAEIGLADENDKYYEDNKDEINSAIQNWATKMN